MYATREPTSKLDLQINVAANAIAWVLFGIDGSKEVDVTERDAALCVEAAKKVFSDLDQAGLYES